MGVRREHARYRCFSVGCDKKRGVAGQDAPTGVSAGSALRLADRALAAVESVSAPSGQ